MSGATRAAALHSDGIMSETSEEFSMTADQLKTIDSTSDARKVMVCIFPTKFAAVQYTNDSRVSFGQDTAASNTAGSETSCLSRRLWC